MAKITAEQMEIGRQWQEFAGKLGWGVVVCEETWAKLRLRDGPEEYLVRIPLRLREDIEATWREKSNVTEIGTGTDG